MEVRDRHQDRLTKMSTVIVSNSFPILRPWSISFDPSKSVPWKVQEKTDGKYCSVVLLEQDCCNVFINLHFVLKCYLYYLTSLPNISQH